MAIAQLVASIFDKELPFRVEAFDGSATDPPNATLTLRILSRDALRRALTHPGELGLARAYVAGDIDLVGSLDPLFAFEMPSPLTLVRAAPGSRCSARPVRRCCAPSHRRRSRPASAACSTAGRGTGEPSPTTTTSPTASTRWSSDRP